MIRRRMRIRLLGIFLLAMPAFAQAYYSFLNGYDEAPTVAKALERLKAEPQKHVLIYFGMSQFCPPCREARAILNADLVRQKWRPNYVVVNIDIFAPTKEERELIEQVRVSWAPVLVFLDASGKRVAYTRQLRNEADALVLNDFVAQRQYALSPMGKYTAQNFDYQGGARMAGAGVVLGTGKPIDDRPRLREVLAHKPERLTGPALQKALEGKVMHKENQDWFLTLKMGADKAMPATGRRKDGKGEMTGAGKWYVTKKGKLCLELKSGGVDENWCRHVYRVGDSYYVSKDQRPERVVYRFVLDIS